MTANAWAALAIAVTFAETNRAVNLADSRRETQSGGMCVSGEYTHG